MKIKPISEQENTRYREETQGTTHVIHFNNAGSSLPAIPVLNAVTEYLNKEALLGGYETEYASRDEISRVYEVIADLVNAQPEEIALVENASAVWCIAFHSIGFNAGDEVLISEYEYVTNMIGYLYGEMRYGIKLKVIPNDENGNFSLSNLEGAITPSTRLIAVTHIASTTGGILPVEKIGNIAARHQILYLVDACQSIGQMPVDVQEIQCDFLSVTGRKYLRAPRGTGFLYVRKNKQHLLNPLLIDGHAITGISEKGYTLRADAKRFELYEKNRALTLGLCAAVDYVLNIGIDRIWQRISYLASYLRDVLQHTEGITVHDTGTHLSGIVTFTIKGHDGPEVKAYLAKNNINVSVGLAHSTLLYMNRHHLSNVVRASVHYYNTVEEINQFKSILYQLKNSRYS